MLEPSLPASLWAQGIDLELILLTVALLAVGFAGYWVVVRVRRWSKEEESERLTAQDQLEQYQAMLDEGLLDRGEFDKLKARLGLPGSSVPPKQDDAPT